MRRTCPICGKSYWCENSDLWAYKRNGRFFCSYGCLRKYDRKEVKEVYNNPKIGEETAIPEEHGKPLEVYSVRSRVLRATYRYEDGHLVLEGPALSMSTLLMTGKEWLEFVEEINTAINQLGVKV